MYIIYFILCRFSSDIHWITHSAGNPQFFGRILPSSLSLRHGTVSIPSILLLVLFLPYHTSFQLLFIFKPTSFSVKPCISNHAWFFSTVDIFFWNSHYINARIFCYNNTCLLDQIISLSNIICDVFHYFIHIFSLFVQFPLITLFNVANIGIDVLL